MELLTGKQAYEWSACYFPPGSCPTWEELPVQERAEYEQVAQNINQMVNTFPPDQVRLELNVYRGEQRVYSAEYRGVAPEIG